MATTPMTPAQLQNAAMSLCARRGLNALDPVPDPQRPNVTVYQWTLAHRELLDHIDRVFLTTGVQL